MSSSVHGIQPPVSRLWQAMTTLFISIEEDLPGG